MNFKTLYKYWLLVLIIFFLVPCPFLALAVTETFFDSMGQPKKKNKTLEKYGILGKMCLPLQLPPLQRQLFGPRYYIC